MHTVRNVTAANMNTTMTANCAIIAPKKTTESAVAAEAAVFAETGSRAIFVPTAALAPKNTTASVRKGSTAIFAGSGFVKTVITAATTATYCVRIAEFAAAPAKIFATNVKNARNAAAEPAKKTAASTVYAWKAVTGMMLLTAVNPVEAALKKMNCATAAALARSAALMKVWRMAVTTAYAWKVQNGMRRITAAAAAANALNKTNSAPAADTAWIAV